MTFQLADLCIRPDASIREAISRIDRGEHGIVLVVDEQFRLVDTITDGDIRRAMLAGIDLAEPIGALLTRRGQSPYPAPVTAPANADAGALLTLMQERRVRQIPLIDDNDRVTALVTLEDLLPSERLPIEAVVMAGGAGSRLRPLTNDVPKPMLPVGGRPLMEHTLKQLVDAGIRRVAVTTHYRADQIVSYFGNGVEFGVELTYVNEDRPLGTAGALGLIEVPNEPLLVINGDILTRVDFRSMLQYHRDHQASLTVAVRAYDMQVPYGVIECDGARVTAIREKPSSTFFVNAGIYLLEPSVFQYIPVGECFDMTDLIARLLEQKQQVISFPVHEYWIDVGHHASYAQARIDAGEPQP